MERRKTSLLGANIEGPTSRLAGNWWQGAALHGGQQDQIAAIRAAVLGDSRGAGALRSTDFFDIIEAFVMANRSPS